MGIRGVAAGTVLTMALSLLCAGTALAGQSGPTKAAADAEGSKRICKNLTTTGSRLSHRICKRKSEWDLEAERARRHLLDLQAKGLRSNINGQ
jgi:hypothetical protein